MPIIGETEYFKDRDEWRGWLEENHSSKKELWLIFYKKHTGVGGLPYDEAVEEALCFGWIDGIMKRIDDRKHTVRFSPRKKRSVWSMSNRERVKRMIAAGRMTDSGMALVQAGKESGQWDLALKREDPAGPPEDLAAALSETPAAQEFYGSLTKSQKKQYIWWVLDAKRPETRARRIGKVVERCAKELKPGMAQPVGGLI